MLNWQSQPFKDDAPPGTPVEAAVETARRLRAINSELPPLFSLRHLAHSAEVPYKFLRAIVARSGSVTPYNVFFISKQGIENRDNVRWIAAPHPLLLKTQRWMNENILGKLKVHDSAYAYVRLRGVYDAAAVHKKSSWVIKVDIENFFESVLETTVYDVFLTAGYQPLLSFEMSRLCTRITTRERDAVGKFGIPLSPNKGTKHVIGAYSSHALGHLPQGAATSPTLANLVSKCLDEAVSKIADAMGLRYTRYSDDIILSTRDKTFGKDRCFEVVGEIYRVLRKAGYAPNTSKTRVSGPGTKRLVLGFLTDGEKPRLTKEFKDKLKMHLYFCRKVGPSAHALNRKFDSVIGLRNHLLGLISYAKKADPDFHQLCLSELNSCVWPILSPVDFSSFEELDEILFY